MEAAKKSAACPDCHGLNYLLERQGQFLAARACRCSRPCKHCGGRGHVYAKQQQGPRSYDVLTPCSCHILDERILHFNQVGAPGVLAHASFDTFLASNPGQHRALEVARAFAVGYGKGSLKGFTLSGPVGCGKTHLLVATLTHLALEAGARAHYTEISLLYATIRRGFQENKSGGEIIQPLSEVEVLAIDELGKGRGSAFELETMDELIARRYNAGRVTLFATNFSLDPERRPAKAPHGHRSTEDLKHASKDSDLLRDRVGERIYSRLCEMCEFVEMPLDSPDRRRLRHELESRARPARREPHGR